MILNKGVDDYWDYYLNNTWYNSINQNYRNMLVEGTYYIERVLMTGSYKLSICNASNVTIKECTKTSSTWTGNTGLLRYGEIFSSQLGSGDSSSSYMWLITPSDPSHIWNITTAGNSYNFHPSNSMYAARPSIHLSSLIKITSGSGTEASPFEISL